MPKKKFIHNGIKVLVSMEKMKLRIWKWKGLNQLRPSSSPLPLQDQIPTANVV